MAVSPASKLWALIRVGNSWEHGKKVQAMSLTIQSPALTLSITQSNFAHVDISPKKTGKVLKVPEGALWLEPNGCILARPASSGLR